MDRTIRARPSRSAALSAAGLAAVVAAALAVPAFATPEPQHEQETPKEAVTVKEDFNGDGFQDMAVGASGWGTGEGSVGYLTVFYGTADGLDRDNAVTISQHTEGVPGEPAEGNGFGNKLVGADLDQDGYTDLAVQVPGAQQVILLWGGADGIDGQRSAVIDGGEDASRTFGFELTTGDFNGDDKPDLLLDRGRQESEHSVLQGPFDRDGGYADEQRIVLTSSYYDVLSVTAGDLNGDGADDLVVHQSFEERGQENLLYLGGEDGLERDGTVPMGATGAVGDFDGDGYGDLAYREMPGGVVENLPYDSGTVKVMYGSAQGPDPDRVQTFTQETAGVPGVDEEGDQFGAALAAGDVTGDGRDDLAVGVPFEAIGSPERQEAGSVVLLRGSADGLTGAGAQAFHQDTAGMPGVAETGDRFGSSVALLDLNGDGHADLTAGAPLEAVGDTPEVGAIWQLSGTAEGLTASGAVAVNPSETGSAISGGRFGAGLINQGHAPLLSRD